MRTGNNIYKRKSGLWEGRYKNGFNQSGKAKYESVYAKTYLDCKDKQEKAQKRLIIITKDKQYLKVNDLFILYFESVKKNSTRSTYKSLYETHIKNTIGELKVSKISSHIINNLLLNLLKSYSESYVSSIRTFILTLFNYAFKTQIIAEKMIGIIRVKPSKKEITIFNESEQANLENYLINNLNSQTLSILIALYTGIRIGELCALMIYDINIETGYININKTMQRVKNLEEKAKTKTKIIIDTPKSEMSVREIPIPNFLINLIKQVIKDYNKNSFFLTGSIQAFIEPRTLEYKYQKILKHCKIEYRKFHTLRHTFATNSLTKNYYDYKTLSEILGHSNPNITLKLYVHSSKAIKSEQVKNIDKDFNSRINYGIAFEKAL